MYTARNPALDDLAVRAGIVFDGAIDFLPRAQPTKGEFGALDMAKVKLAMDGMGLDAANTNNYGQPTLVTSPNGGIPAFLTTYLDPKLIAVLLTPLKAEDIYGVTKKGDWITQTAMFIMAEMTGFTAAYGDFNEAGRSDANVNYPQRQSFNFQTFTEWGDMQLERMAAGKVDWAATLNISSANTLNRFMNLLYFYGAGNGLQNYGGLNDPSLSASLTPATKAAGGTSWANALPTEILADVQTCYAQLTGQAKGLGGNIARDSKMTLAIDPTTDTYIANTNSFGLTAAEMIKKAFPNITIKTAVQYLSGTTYSLQLIADEVEGQRTAEAAFNEKMRAHRIIPATSSFRQKKSAGCWGTIIYRPAGIVSMAGV
jgi:hypothetical protein